MVSRRFNVPVNQLKEMNDLTGGEIYAGQSLIVKKQKVKKSKISKKVLSSKDIDKLGADKYIVTRNDSLHAIAKKNNTSVTTLMKLNNISGNEKLIPGQVLIVK